MLNLIGGFTSTRVFSDLLVFSPKVFTHLSLLSVNFLRSLRAFGHSIRCLHCLADSSVSSNLLVTQAFGENGSCQLLE